MYDNIIKDILRYIRDIRNLSELENEEEYYYKPIRFGNFHINNYIKYESNGLSIEEYLNAIRSYLKVVLNNIKKSDS